MSKIKVTLKKSTIACKPEHKVIAATLGLRKVGATVEHESCPSINGMIAKISYLLQVEEVADVKKKATRKKAAAPADEVAAETTEQEVTE